jgi:Rieske Fe-S protein
MSQSSDTSHAAPADSQRRGFLVKSGAVVLGALAGLVPAFSGLVVFLDPLRRRGNSDSLVRVTTLDSLPDDGIPRQFPVIAERVDAWNRSLEPVGAVYLRRQPGQEQPECWTATCPHAGCFVDFDTTSRSFKCPCHNSSFQIDGQIIQPSPSPRAMDTLECKLQGQEVLVRFENFYTGKTEKVAKP